MLVNGRTDLMDGQLSDSTRLNSTTVPRWRSQTVAFRAVFLLVIVFGLVVENLVFRTLEQRTIRRWGMQS